MLGGVILAGGRNRRMGGRPKALLHIGGQPLLLRQLKEMARLCSQITVVTNTPELLQPATDAFDQADLQWIPDIYEDCGPVGGIHAACTSVDETYLWIVGCDMPMISAQAARAMYEAALQSGADGVVPVIHGKDHPLHAIYRRSTIGAAAEKQLFIQSYKLMVMLESLFIVSFDEAFFQASETGIDFVTNINTPEDYANINKRLG